MDIEKLFFYKTNAEIKSTKKYNGLSVNLSLLKMAKIKDMLSLDFGYIVNYNPEIAVLSLDGKIILKGKKKEVDEVYSAWTKTQTLPKELASRIANVVTTNCQITGVLVSKALELPAPIIPPKISFK
ncbi:MAG TPA: hypothetical protein VI912_03870 [Candidatus Bilamarchaeaceae archaeon]|nr:hypothetical protein [Candidatus Bilamarchaeaceae archaeon]